MLRLVKQRALAFGLALASITGLAACDDPVMDPTPPGLARFDAAGPFPVQVLRASGFTFFNPVSTGIRHPVVSWGNISGATADTYAPLLTNFASHGVIVVVSNVSNSMGPDILAGIDTAFAAGSTGGMLSGRVDERACVAGHGGGGAGAVQASADPRVECTVPISPDITFEARADGSTLQSPTLILAGGDDVLLPVDLNGRVLFDASQAPTILAVLGGAGLFEVVPDGGGFRGYATAFLVANLQDDPEAEGLFFGPMPGIAQDDRFDVELRNF